MNEILKNYLDKIEDIQQKEKVKVILSTIENSFPDLEIVVKWNQPMFITHGTFIIAISYSKKHISIAPEQAALSEFEEEFTQKGYHRTKELLLYPWDEPHDLELINKMVAFNIEDKKEMTKLWR